jgi:hypothetical protein
MSKYKVDQQGERSFGQTRQPPDSGQKSSRVTITFCEISDSIEISLMALIWRKMAKRHLICSATT